jgi:TonB family protein
MKIISTHVRILIVGILLSVCSPIALGQTHPHTPPGRQAGTTLQILSPARGADFSGYTRDLKATLTRKWIYLMPESFYMGDTGIVDVRVQVRADGTFVNADPKVERSSGKDALDAAAVAAVRASAPFPCFPSGFEGATIELKISFFYNIPVKKPITTPEPAKSEPDENSPK